MLTDASYKITNNTATLTATGTGTYTITVDGVTVSFTAETPVLSAQVKYDLKAQESGSVSGTSATPASLLDGAMTMVGGLRFQNGTGAQINKGTLITFTEKGAITIEWFGGDYGTTADGRVTYKDGYATLEIIGAGAIGNGAYIKTITLDRTNIPADTKYTVTFNSNGGSAVASVQVLAGEKVTKPADPTYDGYTFVEWCTDEACLTAFDFDSENITGDITLYAKWKNDSSAGYTVTINVWGQKFVTAEVEDGETLSVEAVEALFKAKGYEKYSVVLFTDAEMTTAFDGTVTEDMTIYAGVISDRAITYTYKANEDGNTAYFNFTNCTFTNSSWLTYGGANSSISMYVTKDTVIKFGRSPYESGVTVTVNGVVMPECGTGTAIVDVSYKATADGIVTITASGTAYLRSISVYPAFNIGDSVNFVGSGLNLQGASKGIGEYEGIMIDATSGKFAQYTQNDVTAIQINANTTFSFYVAEGITADNLKVTFLSSNDSYTAYTQGTQYTVTVNDGIATVTVNTSIYIKAIKLEANA